MKSDLPSSYEVHGLEAPLPELGRLRKTSRCEVPPAHLQAQVRGRLLASVSQQRRFAGRRPPLRPLLLAAVVLLGVPSAIAATGLGDAWVERVLAYLPGYSADTAQPERELQAVNRVRTQQVVSRETPAPSPLLDPVSELPGVAPEPSTETPEPSSPSSSGVQASSPDPGPPSSGVRQPTRTQRAPVHSPVAATSSALHGSSLHAERILLEQARVRLNAADALGVLQLTAQHERRYPAGLLTEERERLRAQAHTLQHEINSEKLEPRGNTE